MTSWSAAALLVVATGASFGCGSRTDLGLLYPNDVSPAGDADAPLPSEGDGGLASGPDGEVILPDGEVILPDGEAIAPNPITSATTGPLAPHCVLTSSCGYEYVPPGYGWAVGTFSVETIVATCRSTKTWVQQLMNGSWVVLEPFQSDLSALNFSDPGAYDTSSPSANSGGDPPTGAPIGSVQAVRACFMTTAGTVECDLPSFIAVTNCFTCPRKNCGIGNYLDQECQCAKNPPPVIITGG
jgi:hypothetical protein